MKIPFVNAYSQLPEACFKRLPPTAVKAPRLIRFNRALADDLGIDYQDCSDQELADVFAGNVLPEGSDPLAMAYCGHQFGQLNPQLGDGRAILLGDVRNKEGALRDIQLKGSGRTPFSRSGDGRSPLGPALREYILCEAMAALGVPTTRALAVVSTGEQVARQQLEPGAVFTRVAASHIRVGTFQYFALKEDQESLQALADHVIARHYPAIDPAANDRYLQLYRAIVHQQAELIAHWMLLGFIHGVMNTDNMTLSGETIDYGPCAFMDAFSADKVFSSIDEIGRYAYQNQPKIGHWNLARLAESMLSLFGSNEADAIKQATAILKEYPDIHGRAWEQGMAYKLGFSGVLEGDLDRVSQLLDLMEKGALDYTLFFRRLSSIVSQTADRSPVMSLLHNPNKAYDSAVEQELNQWLDQWQLALVEREGTDATALNAIRNRMDSINPAIIPRNHRVAEAIQAAEQGDYAVFEQLLAAVAQPYESIPQYAMYQQPPEPEQEVMHTFCGT